MRTFHRYAGEKHWFTLRRKHNRARNRLAAASRRRNRK